MADLLRMFMDVRGDRKRREAELADFKQRTTALEDARVNAALDLQHRDAIHQRWSARKDDENMVEDLRMKAITANPDLHPAEATILARQQLRDIKTNPDLARAATTALSAQEAYGAMPYAKEVGATGAQAGIETNRQQKSLANLNRMIAEQRMTTAPQAAAAVDNATFGASLLDNTRSTALLDTAEQIAQLKAEAEEKTARAEAAEAALSQRLASDPETFQTKHDQIVEQGVAARYGIENPEHSRRFNPFGDLPSMDQWVIQNWMNKNRSNSAPTTATPDTGGVMIRKPRGVTLPQ